MFEDIHAFFFLLKMNNTFAYVYPSLKLFFELILICLLFVWFREVQSWEVL